MEALQHLVALVALTFPVVVILVVAAPMLDIRVDEENKKNNTKASEPAKLAPAKPHQTSEIHYEFTGLHDVG